MAATETYVNIQKMGVNQIFDNSFKALVPPIMQKAAEKAVKSAKKLTLDEPKEKGAKGYSLDGSMTLNCDKDAKKLSGECSLVISTWPGKAIKALPTSKASMAVDDVAKIDKSDVADLVQNLIDGAMGDATKYMEKNPP